MTTEPAGGAVSVVIPMLNPGVGADSLLASLFSQTLRPQEILVIDSSSQDGSPQRVAEAGAKVVSIGRADFHHATARNLALLQSAGEYLVFLTQDAVPKDSKLVELLISALRSGAAAAYARQVPRPEASPLERYARSTNYPSVSTDEDVDPVGNRSIRSVFFSNSCSAIRRDVFEQMGGFPTHTIMNEDMIFASRLLQAGHAVTYVPEALVEHSHNYTTWQTFKRYFDIGVVFEQAREELAGRDTTQAGIQYVRGLFTTLWRDRQYAWLPAAFAESAAKWVGTFLGKRHKLLPLPLVKRLSLHRSYWERTS